MNKLEKILYQWKNYGFDNETLERFQHDIDKRNLKALRAFCFAYAVMNAIFFVLEFFFNGSTVSLMYLAGSFILCLLFGKYFSKIILVEKPHKLTSIYVTIFSILTYGFTAFWSIYIQSDEYGVFLICMLFFLPFVVYERPLKSLIQVILVAGLFSGASFLMKTEFYALSDTVHAIIAAIAGTTVSYTKNRQLIEEISVRKKLESANTELKYLNTVDPLTELYNRKKIFNILEDNILKSKTEKKSVACAIMDLDYFKTINDTFGHPKGDVILKNTGAVIANIIKEIPEVYAGRIGGEEFMILAYDMEVEAFSKICKDMNYRINQIQIYNAAEKKDFNASASFGLCVLRGENLSSLYNYADKALYHAKKNGRNCTWQYDVHKKEYILS